MEADRQLCGRCLEWFFCREGGAPTLCGESGPEASCAEPLCPDCAGTWCTDHEPCARCNGRGHNAGIGCEACQGRGHNGYYEDESEEELT